MRPGREYFKWEDRSEGTKKNSGKSMMKDNGGKEMSLVRIDAWERNRWTEYKDR